MLQCPNCNSAELQASHKGKTNVLLQKGIHIFGRTLSHKEILIKCEKCQHKFSPVEAQYSAITEEFAGTKAAQIEDLILETIKSNGVLETIKTYKILTGSKLGEVKIRVEQVAVKHSVEVKNKMPIGCYFIIVVILLVVTGVVLGIVDTLK